MALIWYFYGAVIGYCLLGSTTTTVEGAFTYGDIDESGADDAFKWDIITSGGCEVSLGYDNYHIVFTFPF